VKKKRLRRTGISGNTGGDDGSSRSQVREHLGARRVGGGRGKGKENFNGPKQKKVQFPGKGGDATRSELKALLLEFF